MIWVQVMFDIFVLIGLWALWVGYSTLTKYMHTMGQLVGELQDGREK